MGLEIALQDEQGKELESVGDPTNILHTILPDAADERFRCLNRVDWYGDTIFNQLQMQDLIPELELVRRAVSDSNATGLLDGIRELAERCQADAHLYLKFYGD